MARWDYGARRIETVVFNRSQNDSDIGTANETWIMERAPEFDNINRSVGPNNRFYHEAME